MNGRPEGTEILATRILDSMRDSHGEEDSHEEDSMITPDPHDFVREKPLPVNHRQVVRGRSSSVEYIDDPSHLLQPSSSTIKLDHAASGTLVHATPMIDLNHQPHNNHAASFAARLESSEHLDSPAYAVTPTPVTFYTTFTYFTTELFSGEPIVHSREQVITNVVSGKILPTRATSVSLRAPSLIFRSSSPSLDSFSLANPHREAASVAEIRVKRATFKETGISSSPDEPGHDQHPLHYPDHLIPEDQGKRLTVD
jgi:hypothetical protein